MNLPEENKRVEKVIDHTCNGNQLLFSKEIGISQPRINRLFKIDNRSGKFPLVSFEIIQAIINKYINISSRWLLTGEGSMLKSKRRGEAKSLEEDPLGIPLIPVDAMAGFGTGEIRVMDYETTHYVVPEFEELNVDFMIRVKGSSMYPQYNSGDIVACKKLSLQDVFFQWNKVYVLDTEQGALVKRIKKGADREHILIVSDNKSYDPFELHLQEINAIALVVGVIRFE